MKHSQIMQLESKIILNLLRERGIRARVTDGYVTPGYYVYQLQMDATQEFAKLARLAVDMQRLLYAGRVRHRLINPNDDEQIVTVRIVDQPLVIEVNRPEIDMLHYVGVISKLRQQPPEFMAIAGLGYATSEGQAITWRLDNPSEPHCLVAGGTGSGKSMLLLGLVFSLCEFTSPHKLRLVVIDGGNSTLQPLTNLPHCVADASDVTETLSVIRSVYAEVLRRKAVSNDNPTDRILIVIDELANLQAVMSKEQVDDLQSCINVITAEGRKYGIHCATCTQKPLAEVVGSLAKTNSSKRFVGAVPSKTDATTCAGIGGTGAEALAGRGDFITVRNSKVRRFQAMYIKNASPIIQDICNKWRAVVAAPLAPVQDKKATVAENYTSDNACTTLAPVYAPPMHHHAPVQVEVAAPLFPLEEKRPLHGIEIDECRRLANDGMSKNALCNLVYGAKSTRYMEWINVALQSVDGGKIIKLRRTA